jgi:N-acetylmuramoyl-L-alanine amidase
MARAPWLLGSLALVGCVLGFLRKREEPVPAAPPSEEVTVWPSRAVALDAAWPSFPDSFTRRRIALDPGHGAPGNKGNTSCFCVDEEAFTLSTAERLCERLESTGHFEVRLTRDGDRRVPYPERVEDAADWGAEVFISLHSDVRDVVAPREEGCPTSLVAPGFSVLYADEGEPALVAARAELARALGHSLARANFLPYGGDAYLFDYESDDATAGVFVDRHAPEQRIFVLHRPRIPSILVETHHALDPREAARWAEDETIDAFAAALAAALAHALR